MKTTLLKVCILMSLISSIQQTNANHHPYPAHIQSLHDVVILFPTSPDEVRKRASQTLKNVIHQIQILVELPPDQLTYDNTLRHFDRIMDTFHRTTQVLEALFNLSPHEHIRKTAQEELLKLQQAAIDLFTYNLKLYHVIAQHAQTRAITESLSDEERRFEQETLEEFSRNGLHLPEDKRARISALQKELANTSMLFDKNINEDDSKIIVSREELAGIDDEFIATLRKTDDGRFILGVDYPTYSKIIEQCQTRETRKKLYEAFSARAYPANIPVLEKIIALRDTIARETGYTSFAHLSLESEMAKTPKIVEQFLLDLWQKASQKELIELNALKDELPASITLTPDGKIYPWDKAYINELHKKQKFNIDEYAIAEYFPMDSTVNGLLKIYESFFSISFKQVSLAGLWHEDVKTLEVYKQEKLIGYILMDLHPRDAKYKHAMQMTIVPALLSENNDIIPSVVVVVANFPKATAHKPSLLLRSDVTTFFHEFGHALHAILGATRLASQSGTHTKHDFVEMPSQMLEEWLFDENILYNLSNHYITGEKLPKTTIATLLKLKNINSGSWITRQIFLSLLSLHCFKEGAHKNTQDIMKTLHEKIRTHDYYDPKNHMQASFGHLTSYGARYYGYLWSKVFALDLFATIKQHGLLNPEIGERYSSTVLGKGGSKDPNELLFDFLGRAPNNEAFFKDLGL